MAGTDYAFTPAGEDNEMERVSRENLRAHLAFMKGKLEESIGGCAELTLAIRKLQEFGFWVNEAIDCGGMKGELFPEAE